MADADRLVAALRYQQEMEDASRPVTVNPLMARKAEAIKQNAPAENMLTQYAETMPQNWQQFGQNMAQAYPTPATGGTQEQILAAAQNLAMGIGPGIVSPHVAKGLNTARSLPQGEQFSAAVANTPGAQITPDGLLMKLQRNQMSNQGLEPSVRGGVFYLPEGAAQAKYYSTGKNGYGGQDKITGETLISNPLYVKGATGGKAPEAAFDLLHGKGAYQSMRNDAIASYGGYGASASQKAEKVSAFLEKYAPDLIGMEGYIIQNSGKGNQLAYALQEAAVASAARGAGHDAVLGYSTSRNTKQPLISEVFDVREMNYPDKSGTPTEIWNSFRK